MINSKTGKTVFAGLFLALGIIIPYFTSHILGIQGTVFLPMHIPVLLTGICCGPLFGAVNGLIVPLLSSILTGMPPAFPMLPIMMCELFIYGLISGILSKKTKLKIYFVLPITMICGRIAYGVIFSILTFTSNTPIKALTWQAALVTGLPGIIIQLILIPAILKAVNLSRGTLFMQSENARKLIASGDFSLILIRNNEIIFKTTGIGISPVIELYESHSELMQGAIAVDKIVGKAAAMLFKLGGINSVYGEIMSITANEYLEKNGIKCSYGKCIEHITNREKNGICPMEKTVLNTEDPHEAYLLLKKTLSNLQKTN